MGRESLGAPFEGGSAPGEGTYLKDPFLKFLSDKGREHRAASFGGRHGVITVVAGFSEQAKLLHVKAGNGRSYFAGNGLQGDLLRANRRLADELALATATYMQEHLRRPGVSSGRLYAALLDPRNRVATQFGFGVGSPEWLDQSEAKYWRQIDQGFSGHLGRVITGVWGATLTGEYGGRSSYGPYPIAGPAFTGFGAGTGGRLRPLGRNAAYRLLRRQLGRSKEALKGNGFGTQGIIRNPIQAEQYFEGGWRKFNARERVPEAIREVVTKAFDGLGIPTTGEIRFRQGLSPTQPAPSKRYR